jgi:predicted nucleic acid-binding protein
MLSPAPFRVVLDACVLYPFSLRDTLLRAAADGFYQLYWSPQILDEVTRNLVENRQMSQAQADRLRAAMERAFPEALITGHEALVDAMPNDPKDRHVVAAAVVAGAQVIVTDNLRDFVPLPGHLVAQSADVFVTHQFDLQPGRMIELLRQQAAALRQPPRTFDELLDGLAKTAPGFSARVRQHMAGAA